VSAPARRGPESAGARLRRLLILLPWLMERGQVPVDEAASRFGISREQLIHDVELAAMCGLPPYVDEMIDLYVDDDVIYAGVPRLFTRPLRMTAREGFSLLASGRAAIELPGAEPGGALARALDKVAAVLGGAPVLRVDVLRPPFLDAVQAAADGGRRLSITYFVANRGERSERVVDPVAVVGDRAHWYLQALDHAAGGERWFRVDRIERLVETGEASTAGLPPAAEVPDWLAQFADAVVVRLRISSDGAWMTERYPVISALPDGPDLLLVELPVLSVRWLERLLLRLGAEAQVLDPPELRAAGATAAERVLARYR
jgi:proteasome accessory factor C